MIKVLVINKIRVCAFSFVGCQGLNSGSIHYIYFRVQEKHNEVHR